MKTVEASLLPSGRIRKLAEQAVFVGVRKADPLWEDLRKEFGARATSWVIVLDPKGELLDAGPADATGALKKQETLSGFPDLLADRIERGLGRQESLQELERRWSKDPKSESAFEALAARFEEMKLDTRLREACEKLAAFPGLPAARYSGALLRGYAVRSHEYGALGTAGERAKYAEEGERLIAEYAAHPAASRALQALFHGGYAGRFDVPAASAAGIARLEAAARGLKEPGPLRERLAELSGIREKEIEALQAARSAARGNEANEAWYAAALGDAEMTIRVYAKSASGKEWVEEAREKLRRSVEK